MAFIGPIRCSHCGSTSIAGVLLPASGIISAEHLRAIQQAADNVDYTTEGPCPLCKRPLLKVSHDVDTEQLFERIERLDLTRSELSDLAQLGRDVLSGKISPQGTENEDRRPVLKILHALVSPQAGSVYTFAAALVAIVTLLDQRAQRVQPGDQQARDPDVPVRRRFTPLPYTISHPPTSGSRVGRPGSLIGFHGWFAPDRPGQELEFWERGPVSLGNIESKRRITNKNGHWRISVGIDTRSSFAFRIYPGEWNNAVQLYFKPDVDGDQATIRWRRGGRDLRDPNDTDA